MSRPAMACSAFEPERRAGPRAEKRERILEAAIRVFAREGYHRSRVSDIAREAGIAYGLVYHYFRNKEEILSTLFEERWSGFIEAVGSIAARPAPARDRLAAVAELMLDAYRARPEWVKVLVLDIQRSSRFAEPGQLRAIGRLFQEVARIVREGQAAGELRRDLDPEVACHVLIGALEIVITSLVLELIQVDGGRADEEAWHRRAARTVVEIFLHGLSARGEAT